MWKNFLCQSNYQTPCQVFQCSRSDNLEDQKMSGWRLSGFKIQTDIEHVQKDMPNKWEPRYTRQVSSMIHSACPQFRPAVIFAWFWSFGTDGWTDGRATCAKIVTTTGRDCGRPRGSKIAQSLYRAFISLSSKFYKRKSWKWNDDATYMKDLRYYVHIAGFTKITLQSRTCTWKLLSQDLIVLNIVSWRNFDIFILISYRFIFLSSSHPDPLGRSTITVGSDHYFHTWRPPSVPTLKKNLFSSENSDRYCQVCGSGRGDHYSIFQWNQLERILPICLLP